MNRQRLLFLLTLSACTDAAAPTLPTAMLTPAAPASATRTDARDGFVTVAPGVRLHYIDFGGSGDPVLLLAGLGNTAHVFEPFARRLTNHFHVFALTRRGFGASTIAPDGYDTRTLAHDVAVALDGLGLSRVTIIGHSISGDEMTRFAADYPERVVKLVYLDAAYDRNAIAAMLVTHPLPAPPAITLADIASLRAFRRYARRVRGVSMPMEELRAQYVVDVNGMVVSEVTPVEVYFAILSTEESPDYSRVVAPSLAIYAVPVAASDLAPWLERSSPEWASTTGLLASTFGPFYAAQRAQFASSVAGARLIELPGANHYVFLSDAERVARAIIDFIEDE